jgi:hypothetical protein
MTVPLSEHEQRILDDIEKSLYTEDPRFARDVRNSSPAMPERRRVRSGIAIFLLGLGLLVTFFATGSIVLGVVAFGVMVGGIVLVAGSLKGSLAPRRPPRRALNERLSQTARGWEDKLRQRYRRR